VENVYREYSLFIGEGLKGLLKDWEESEKHRTRAFDKIKEVEQERDQIISNTHSDGNNISHFISLKLDQLKGLDAIASRQNRIMKLDVKLSELQEELRENKSEKLSRAICPEYQHMRNGMEWEVEAVLEHFLSTMASFARSRKSELSNLL
jgi:hypothetical protein